MSFYLKPPRGQINFHNLEECVKQRLSCYDNISENSETKIDRFDYLIEDSALDRAGHFIFRIKAYSSISFREFFLQNEQKLLLLRLNSYNKRDVNYLLKTLVRQLKSVLEENNTDEHVSDMLIWFIKIFSYMLGQKYLSHIFSESHTEIENCEEFKIRVPFFLCPSLLSSREVNVHRGFLEIQCNDWKKLLLSLYLTYLKNALEEMKYSQNVQMTLDDDRVKEVLKLIKYHGFEYSPYNRIVGMKFDIRKIEAELKLFPLCMSNLHRTLQSTNRLSHTDRFDFSLYMKGIGVTLSDSLKFWETAYSKQHACFSKCTHNWQKNEKRYIYGIRHLYGLEGSRRNYQVRPCTYFQEQPLGANEDGGCPFKHFDDDNLRQVLKRFLPGKEDEVEVMIYERKDSPKESCKLFYESIFQTITSKSIDHKVSFYNPVEYYLGLRSAIAENGMTKADVNPTQDQSGSVLAA